MDIPIGATVEVKITATPQTHAARRTLERIGAKDPDVARRHRRLERLRPSWTEKRRGGRYWHHQMQKAQPVKLDVGATYTIRATLDVVRDLGSVERCISVTPKS